MDYVRALLDLAPRALLPQRGGELFTEREGAVVGREEAEVWDGDWGSEGEGEEAEKEQRG